jgi:thiol:disulfide interchange protein DsbA
LQATPALAQLKPPEEGIDYIKLDKPAATDGVKGKIEVVEFFWYHCPHCHRFEPTLQAWLKKLPKDVHFRRMHVAFRADFVLDQQLFYTLEAMGKVEQMHAKVFAAIHVEKLDLTSREKIIDWVSKQGIDKTKFTQIYDSFAIGSKATRATQLQNAYNVTGVPALGIAGQFYTDGSLAQSMERALQVTDHLISTQRKK